MRVYKINNQYIDLDHVLVVSELEFKKYPNYGEEALHEAWFTVALAFQEKDRQIGFELPWDKDFIVEEETEKMRQEYEKFLYAWQNKPSVVIPDPLPTIQVRTGKPR